MKSTTRGGLLWRTSWRLGDNPSPTSRHASVSIEGPRGIEIKASQQRYDEKKRSRQEEHLCEDSAGRWSECLHLMTVCGVRSSPRIWAQDFECFVGEEVEMQMIMVEHAQLQDHLKDQGEELFNINLAEEGKEAQPSEGDLSSSCWRSTVFLHGQMLKCLD